MIARRITFTLAFLPLLALLLFLGKHQTDASVAPTRVTTPVTDPQDFSVLKATSVDSRFVEVPVGEIPSDFQGLPLHRFAEAIQRNPNALSFHLTWYMSTPGGEILGEALYVVKSKEIMVMTREGNIDVAWNRNETDYYSHVTRDKIFRLARKYPSEQTYEFDNFAGLIQFGCSRKTDRRK